MEETVKGALSRGNANLKTAANEDTETDLCETTENMKITVDASSNIEISVEERVIQDTIKAVESFATNPQDDRLTPQFQSMTISIEISKDVDILLIGKTGKGKSALGNSLLSRNAFVSSDDVTSITDDVSKEYGIFEGRTLKVVDTPGVCDTRMSEEDALKMVTEKMADAIDINPDGYHAFIYVIKYGERFTDEDVTALQILKKIFGADFVNIFCILILTCGDNFEKQVIKRTGITFKEWCAKQLGVFKQLLDECEGRIVLFDNFTDEPKKMYQQKRELINVIDRLQSSGKRYTNKYFDKAKETRDTLLIECKIPALKDKILRETGVIMSSYNQMNLQDPENKIEELEEMQKRSNLLLNELSEEDKKSGALCSLIDIVQNVDRTLEAEIKACRLLIHEREKKNQELLILQQQIEKDKEILKCQEEAAKREHEEHLKEMEAKEKQRIEEKEMLEKEMIRRIEEGEMKFKNKERELMLKQEELLKEHELNMHKIESDKELKLQELLQQADQNQQQIELLQAAVKDKKERKRLELELKEKEIEAEREKQKEEYQRKKEEDEKKFKLLEETQKMEYEIKLKELEAKTLEIEVRKDYERRELEKINKQKETQMENLRHEMEEQNINKISMEQQHMKQFEEMLIRQKLFEQVGLVAMLHSGEMLERKQEHELRLKIEDTKQEIAKVDREAQEQRHREMLASLNNQGGCSIQ